MTENHQNLVTEIDAAVQAHLEWTRRVLRCAVLRVSPGTDVLKIESHTLCRFGRWFSQNRSFFESIDPQKTRALEINHRAMHSAIRDICSKVLEGIPGEEADLSTFETTQTLLIAYLSEFKTRLVQSDSQLDPLTGLPMRHRLEENFDVLKRRSHRQWTVPMVMMVDIDHFKSINDTHGHAAGDIVIREMAECLKRTLRGGDQVYRFGGEEFVVLGELASMDGAEAAGARLMEAVHALTVTLPGGGAASPTVTIGIAMVEEDESFNHAVHRADMALYEGKYAGRDRCAIAPCLSGNAAAQ